MFQNAEWIWGCRAAQPDEYCDFELCFTVSAGRHYSLHLSCDTDYALYKDGTLLAHGQYPDYPDYKIYDTIDLNACVQSGESRLLLSVWYQGIDCSTYNAKAAAVIFVLTEDGVPVLCSGSQTPCRVSAGYRPHLGRMISSQLGASFSYDAELAAGEFAPSFPVTSLTKTLLPRPVDKLLSMKRMPAEVVQSGGFLYRSEADAAVRMQNAALISRTKHMKLDEKNQTVFSSLSGEDGVYVILDMGRETAGLLDLDFEVDEPCELLIGWGEHLADGRCRTAVRNFSCEYRAKAGRNRFVHPFRRFGGRYVQLFVPVKELRLYYAGIAETLYPLTAMPFDSENLLRKRIYEVCLNTLRQCMHEHYEDCPWREQALYTLDSRNQMLCGYYAFGETRFPRACLELISHSRRPDGLLTLCAPAGTDFPIPAFSLVYFIQMREYLAYSGDVGFLREKYSFLRELMNVFLTRMTSDNLIDSFPVSDRFWNFYEWSEGMDGRLESDHVPSAEAPLGAFLSLALNNLAQIAETLEQPDDAAMYREKRAALNRAIAEKFYHPETRLFRSFSDRRKEEYSVLTNSLCLLCGAAEGLDQSVILDVLSHNGAAQTGLTVIPNTLSMNGFRFDALLAADKDRYAPVILAEIDRTYLAMLQKDATSFWETALGEADFGGAGSLCHGWTALPVYYYRALS